MSKQKKIYIALGILLIAVLCILLYRSSAAEIATIKIQRGNIVQTVEDTAIVQSKDESRIFAEQSAIISHLYVETGHIIKPDQILMVLENPDLNLQVTETQYRLSQAQANLAAAAAGVKRLELELEDRRKDYVRVQELYKQGAVSKSEYEKAFLLLNSTEAALSEQQSGQDTAGAALEGLEKVLAQLLSKQNALTIKSPIEGTVLSLNVKKDQPVMPGELLAVVGSSSVLEVKAEILSDDLAEVETGQKVIITAPVLGDSRLSGTVQKIYPGAEEKISALGVIQRRVPVIISLDNTGNLRPGYEVKIIIETQRLKDVLLVPRESIRTASDGSKTVLLVKQNRVKHCKVELGKGDSFNVAVLKGVKEGDAIVRDAGQDLPDNARVKAIP